MSPDMTKLVEELIDAQSYIECFVDCGKRSQIEAAERNRDKAKLALIRAIEKLEKEAGR